MLQHSHYSHCKSWHNTKQNRVFYDWSRADSSLCTLLELRA